MKHNFFAGPSLINKSVLETTINQISKIEEEISVLEKSHRSKQFGEIMEETIYLTKELLGLGDEFEVIYLQGGGRQQFYQIPYNLSEVFKTSYYIDTGEWSQQAIKEAKFFGNVEVLASSQNQSYKHIPQIPEIPKDAAYTYITTNNTIYGTQYKHIPDIKGPLIADMTSDLFTRQLDFSKFDLFYSGTQKNIGTAGACMVALKPSLLRKKIGSIPTMIDYRTHINKNSLYNTPPIFAIIMALNTLRWYKYNGGIKYFETQNKTKADLLYKEIDRNELFKGYGNTEDRSNINVVFTTTNNSFETKFLEYVNKHNIEGIKGHRILGGFRASMYNALELSSVKVLVEAMKEFERTI